MSDEVASSSSGDGELEQIELEMEASTAIDQCSPSEEDVLGDGLHKDADDTDVGDEKLPAYDSLDLAHHELPAINQQKANTFIAEAPPPYHKLFGRKFNSSSFRRPHTRARRRGRDDQSATTSESSGSIVSQLGQRYPRLRKLIIRLSVICIISCLVGVSAAMILIGSFNYSVCASGEVPIYLLVAGMLMIAELLFHGVLWLLMKYSDSDSTYRAMRMCDCVAFVLLIWLLIGSNWVFKLSIAHYHTSSVCETYAIDDIVRAPNVTSISDGSGGTEWVVVTDSTTSQSSSGIDCADCSSSVYQFTVIVILLQYIAALIVLIGCCSKVFRK